MVKPVGEGSYGSVYRPPLKCINKKINDRYQNNNYVMKVSTEETIDNEIQMSNVLRKIDPYSKYFIYILHNKVMLDVNVSEINSHFVKNNPDKKFFGYYMKYGGMDLNDYYSLYKHKITIKLVWKWLNTLLEAIDLLQTNKILHLDIKTNNIVIDSNDDIRLIDFGLSNVITDDVEVNRDMLIDESYSIYPLFYNVLHCQYKELLNMYQELDPNPSFIKKFIKECDEDEEVYVDTTLMPNLYKIDIYSIGYIFLVYFYKAMKIKFSKANEFLSYHLKCLTIRMTNINPSKQINIKQCMLYLNAVNSINLLDLIFKLKKIIWKYWSSY